MKYSGTIATIIKKRKALQVYEFDGMQWIGDGAVLYPIFGMRDMKDEELVRFLDLDPSEIDVHHMYSISLDLSSGNDYETLIDDRGSDIYISGEQCRTYFTAQGAVFFKSKYFVPVDRDKSVNLPADVYLRTYKKDGKDVPYAVVKKGFYVYAVVCPVDTWTEPQMYKSIEKLAARILLSRRNFSKYSAGIEAPEGESEE